jgi:hypothetical protein
MLEDGMTMDNSAAPAAAPTYALSLKGEGITVERDVSADIARDIIAVVLGGGTSVRRVPHATPMRGSAQPTTGISLREFIDAAGAKKNPQIATAIGLYLIDHDGQDRFTRGDVKSKFSDAGEPTPSNIGRDVALAKTSGWIAEEPRNEFYVTDSGRRAVEAGFQGFAVRRPRRRSSKKTRASTKEP